MVDTDTQTEAAQSPPAEDDAAWVDFIVTGILRFCEVLADREFRPYQVPFAYRVVESVIVEDTADITALFSRQSGKTEAVCNVLSGLMVLLPRLARLYPKRLGKFKDGVYVGMFAPVEDQADTLFGRLVDRLTSEQGTEILADPEIDDVAKGNSKQIRLRRCGSYALKMTANPKARIESKTFHIVVIDEAQDCDDFVISKSIMPMMAATAGTSIMTGTPTTHKGAFYEQIRQNKRDALTRRAGKSNHYEADWKVVSLYSPEYKKFVSKEREKKGEESDEFQMSYCVSADTRILTADLRHIPASDIKPGDLLVGFDEERPGVGAHRRFKETVVEAVGRVVRPCYRLLLSDGTSLVCSTEHQWLVSTPGRRTVWKTTETLTSSDRIFRLTDTWGTEPDYDTGYLAAAFEGEGCLSNPRPGHWDLSFAQRENVMLDQVRWSLHKKGYQFRQTSYTANNGVQKLHLAGGRAAILRFLGEIRPSRLLEKFDLDRLGSIGRHDHVGQNFEHPQVVSKEYLGEREVIAIRTTSRTYVAEGLASHNCLKWLLDRGMFTTETRMDELGDVTMQELVKAWQRTPLVVGIDPAKTIDSTVVTVVWVDWDRPDEFGLYRHRVLNWLELEPGIPLEQQYHRIVDFLEPYSLFGVAVDQQGMGMAVVERLAILLRHKNCEVVGMNSNPTDQNKRWKHLTTLMDRGYVGWPAGAKVKRLRTWKRFYQQMVDAEKHFQGPNLMIKAPEENGAHDDFVDSLALATALTAELSVPEAEQITAPWARGR